MQVCIYPGLKNQFIAKTLLFSENLDIQKIKQRFLEIPEFREFCHKHIFALQRKMFFIHSDVVYGKQIEVVY